MALTRTLTFNLTATLTGTITSTEIEEGGGEGPSFDPIVYNTFQGADWPLDAGTYTTPTGQFNRALTDAVVLLGDGRYIAEVTNLTDVSDVWLSLNISAELGDHDDDDETKFAASVQSGFYAVSDDLNGVEVTASAATEGDLFCLHRVGQVVTMEVSSDSGASWSAIYTFDGETSATLYARCNVPRTGPAKVTPSGVGFTETS